MINCTERQIVADRHLLKIALDYSILFLFLSQVEEGWILRLLSIDFECFSVRLTIKILQAIDETLTRNEKSLDSLKMTV